MFMNHGTSNLDRRIFISANFYQCQFICSLFLSIAVSLSETGTPAIDEICQRDNLDKSNYFSLAYHNGICYQIYTRRLEWKYARGICTSQSLTKSTADLAVIKSKNVSKFLHEALGQVTDLQSKSFWIGAFSNVADRWQWVDGTGIPLSSSGRQYANWGPDQPRSFFGRLTGDRCLTASRKGSELLWFDQTCSALIWPERYRFICQFDALSVNRDPNMMPTVTTSLIICGIIALVIVVLYVAVKFVYSTVKHHREMNADCQQEPLGETDPNDQTAQSTPGHGGVGRHHRRRRNRGGGNTGNRQQGADISRPATNVGTAVAAAAAPPYSPVDEYTVIAGDRVTPDYYIKDAANYCPPKYEDIYPLPPDPLLPPSVGDQTDRSSGLTAGQATTSSLLSTGNTNSYHQQHQPREGRDDIDSRARQRNLGATREADAPNEHMENVQNEALLNAATALVATPSLSAYGNNPRHHQEQPNEAEGERQTSASQTGSAGLLPTPALLPAHIPHPAPPYEEL